MSAVAVVARGQRVELEDHEQDLLRFDLDEEGVVRNANLQGWVWNGRWVDNFPLTVGDTVRFSDGMSLIYPVRAVEDV